MRDLEVLVFFGKNFAGRSTCASTAATSYCPRTRAHGNQCLSTRTAMYAKDLVCSPAAYLCAGGRGTKNHTVKLLPVLL